jgi:hypothetical protein
MVSRLCATTGGTGTVDALWRAAMPQAAGAFDVNGHEEVFTLVSLLAGCLQPARQ